jgi:outer membrane protein assembly factor BamB
MGKILFAAAMLVYAATSAAFGQSVVTYHNSPARSGLYTAPGLTYAAAATLHPDFSAPLIGYVYAQPLYWKPSGAAKGLVIVATEANLVYALDAGTGKVVWLTQLAKAVPLSDLPCGNIPLEGVTGTPVIDPSTGTLYFEALTLKGSNVPREMWYALSLSNGKILPNWPVDVTEAMAALNQTFSSYAQGDRSAAQLFNGKLYFSYAGRAGDCGSYRGRVIEVTPSPTPKITGSWWTRAHGGGIWAQGGVGSDGAALYTTTGNTFSNSVWVDGEAIIRLKPGLARSTSTADYFVPTNWKTLDSDDLDLGGTEALPLNVPSSSGPVRRMLALGKDGNAYLVNRSNLGGIGGALKIVKVSNGEIITAPAVYNTTAATLVAFTGSSAQCGGGAITVLRITPSSISEVWCAAFGGGGAPIITTTDGTANPIVWVVGPQGNGELHGFNALTGKTVFNGSGSAMSGLRHFVTILSANGRLYVGADSKLYAFAY